MSKLMFKEKLKDELKPFVGRKINDNLIEQIEKSIINTTKKHLDGIQPKMRFKATVTIGEGT